MISGCELKVRLNGLGLSPPWFAKRLGVRNRTVVRWFDEGVVPQRAIDELDRLSDQTLDEMRAIIAQFDDETDEATITTYRTNLDLPDAYVQWPATWHRALTFRVVEHLRASGVDVHVEYA